MWRYPLGSGGKRVCTRPLYLAVLRSSMKRSRMKLEGRDSGAGLVPVSGSAAGVVIIFDLTAKKAGRTGGRFARAPSVRAGKMPINALEVEQVALSWMCLSAPGA